MKLSTRSRILAHLRKQQTLSVRELSRTLRMTGANIRHHLAVLKANDLVEIVGQQREGRGRPSIIYGLPRHVLGDGLDELSAALLNVWLGGLPPMEQEAGLRAVAGRIGEGFMGDRTGALPKRLIEMVRFLDQFHYQAHWEAGAAGARVILGHCPYAGIIEKHPELCLLDKFLLEGCLGQGVVQSARLESTDQRLTQCTFLVLQVEMRYRNSI